MSEVNSKIPLIKNQLIDDSKVTKIKQQDQIETEKHNSSIKLEQQKITHQSEIHELDVKKYKFAKNVYIILMIAVVVYIIVVLSISIFSSEIDKHIIITMLSTTTANIIGVFMIASKWLFYNKSK